MSDEQHIDSDKSRYLSAPKRTEVTHRSGLPSLKASPRIKKLFTLKNGRKIEAEHVVVTADRVGIDTAIHPSNPRNQEAVTDSSVSDLLKEIEERGVDTEGIAVRKGESILLIEGSRRRYCCIKVFRDLPLWVINEDLGVSDINSIIRASQTSKRFSYREVGIQYIKEMEEHGFSTNEELANYLGTSHVSVSKRLQAARINNGLISLFPDCESIPNSFYTRLDRLQKNVQKSVYPLDELIKEVKESIKDIDVSDILEAQKIVMKNITNTVDVLFENTDSSKWDTTELADFENKDKYARISKNATGRKVRIEFNRLSKDIVEEIEEFIRSKLRADT